MQRLCVCGGGGSSVLGRKRKEELLLYPTRKGEGKSAGRNIVKGNFQI